MRSATRLMVWSAVSLPFLLLGCSGGSGESGTANFTGNVNAQGFPDVAGSYSFISSDFNAACSDGSTGTAPPVALNFTLLQSINVVSLGQIAPTPFPGVNVLQSSGASGNVTRNGEFLITEILTATVSGISGNVTVTYTLQGSFSPTGWTGTYRVRASFSAGFCDYIATFSGTKLFLLPLLAAALSPAVDPLQSVLPTDALVGALAGQ